jgi:hypothetical protein
MFCAMRKQIFKFRERYAINMYRVQRSSANVIHCGILMKRHLVHNDIVCRSNVCRPMFRAQIQTYADVYPWVNETLFPNLYSYGWYNGDPPSTWRDMQQMNDHVTIRLGIGRLRQMRIKDGITNYMKL